MNILFRYGLSTVLLSGLSLLCSPLLAVILYSGDNSTNLTSPDLARENAFNSVGRITGSARGSVVHIRGKYLLTANHVNVNTNSVTFDSITTWQLDTLFSPVQIDSADMKLIKLKEDPGLLETPLFESPSGDTNITATLIGWGVGRDPNVADAGTGTTNIWDWGNSSTMAKRWGTNLIRQAATGNVAGYNYDYLITFLNRNAGNDEAAAAIYDSGSGLFIEDGGTWKLVGMTTAITSINGPTDTLPQKPTNSTFGSGTSFSSDQNFFVRIGSYASDIEAAIPNTDTLSGWKLDHSLYGADADNSADTDLDGVEQILEFALGGDPNENDISISPTYALVEDGGSTYLELTITRPIGLINIAYTPQTTTDIKNWLTDSSGILDDTPTPTNNGDGTETLVYRRSAPVSATDEAFIRLEVSEAP